ncbi:mitochondrial 2-oxodicarboxylate carrier-like [Littorina saxatilis]|uniref:mitochondrial 2-oxodicarboxylate carrier-like n=1 Tax=Littorina saxatilis TaxID=31220 RepID=UPI0038B5557A
MATPTAKPPKEFSAASLAAMQFAAGGCAGFIEVSMMHPLDLIKTRFQIQGGPSDPHHYSSIADCFKKMYRQEGLLSFYKGILPPLLAETPKRATKFFSFERYKNLFAYGNYIPQSVVLTLAGLSAGMTEAIVINPFEVIKVRLQSERRSIAQQKSTFQTAREIVAADGLGLKGLNKGLSSTLGRHGVFNMIYFSFYHNVKGIVPEAKDPTMDFFRRFLIGLCAGTLSSVVNIPFDVAKSRIQGPQPPEGIKYRTCFQTLSLVYKEEGYFALYKGLLPKILRLGPGGAIMLLVYEYSFDWMQNNL